MGPEAPITGGRLVVVRDGRAYDLEQTPVVIGRDAGNDIVLPGRQVSRRHAEIVATSHGYLLIDRSSNGTVVNGERVDGQRLLSPGDVISCGGHDLRFSTRPSAGPAQPRAAPGAQQRLADTMHGLPATPPPGAAQRLSNTMHGMPAGAPLATLIVRSGPLKGLRFPVRMPVTNIGRGEYNDFVLADQSVSTAHAKLQRREGIWVLVDLDSTNGTLIDGQRVAGEAPLAPGADVRFGDVSVVFEPTDDGVQTQPGGGTGEITGLDVPPGSKGPDTE